MLETRRPEKLVSEMNEVSTFGVESKCSSLCPPWLIFVGLMRIIFLFFAHAYNVLCVQFTRTLLSFTECLSMYLLTNRNMVLGPGSS